MSSTGDKVGADEVVIDPSDLKGHEDAPVDDKSPAVAPAAADAPAGPADGAKVQLLDVPPVSSGTVGRVFRLARFEFLLIVLGVIGAVGEGLMPIVFYWLFGDLVAVLAVPSDPNFIPALNRVASWMAGIAGISAVCGFTKECCLSNACTRIGVKVRSLLFRRMAQQEIGFFDKTKTGTLLTLLSEDMVVFQSGYGDTIGKLLQFMSQFISGLIMSFTRSWQMSLVILAAGPVLGIALGIQSKLQAKFTAESTEASSKCVSTAEEVITSMRTIRSFSSEMKEADRFAANLAEIQGVAKRKGVLQGIGYGSVMFFIWGAAALSFWYGGTLVNQGKIQVGDVVTVFGLMLMAVLGLAQAMGVIPEFTKAATAGGNIFALIEREPHIPFSGGVELPQPTRGEIEFRDVEFKYPTRDAIVLKKVNFVARQGQKVAFVGSSGSGKSTLFNLVQRFYDTTSGQVLFDGVDVKTIDPPNLRAQMSTVAQEPILFATSIMNNIRYSRPDATDFEVEEAARKANAHTFITSFKDGYKTLLGERGITLSGGQKQRVAIARAILCNPRILLLDEATSSLDTESEQQVQEALDVAMEGRTSLVIAHRLATIKDADVIFVMNQGVIEQVGTHDSLLRDETGLYHKLASRQLLSAN